ncbi:MAG: DNA primase [Tenericutes bacterium]|nr:DNA primase [Mycoplasmatota bacterium]
MDNTNIINEIRSKVDIVDIISSYLPLTQKGKNFFGVCPFHDDTNPSMSVSREKQIYRCFSCGASGNVFNFIMDYEHVSFKEALSILANKTGIEIKGLKLDKKESKYDKLYEIYELAHKYYQNNMSSSYAKKAKEYLNNRHIDEDMIKEYKIGLSLDKSDNLTKLLLAKGYDLNTLNSIGLANYDKDVYMNRIMFPLYDLNGRVVGFSGRRYDGIKENKYVNTKGTNIFQKGETLYNYHNAREFVRSKNQVIVMEGFMAVIRTLTTGIKNVVALMGTAMTKEQANLIKRLSTNVVLCFDGDEPGRKACLDNGNELEKLGCDVSIVELDGGLDPDDYILKYGGDDFKNLVKNAITLSDYRIKRLKKNINLNSDLEKTEYINNVLAETSKIEDEIHQEFILKKLAKEFNISYNTLEKRLLSFEKENSKEEKKTELEVVIKPNQTEVKKDKYYIATNALLYYMLVNKKCLEYYNSGKINFLNEDERYLASEISYYEQKYGIITPADFYTYLQTKEELLKVLNRVLELELDQEVTEKTILDYIKTLKDYRLKQEINRLEKELKDENDVMKQANIALKIAELRKNQEL